MRITARGSAARMKAAKAMGQKIVTEDSSRQVLYKLEYINKGGWSTSVWKEFETGKDLLRLAKLEEVVPNLEAYYITNPHRINKFNLITFSHIVEWETIKEFIRERRIYVKTSFDKSTIKSSSIEHGGFSKPVSKGLRGSINGTLFNE